MKIVVIGAGSHVFALTVLSDAIEKHRLDGLRLALVDMDRQAAETMAGVARRMAADVGVRCEAEAFSDRRAALPGADFVVLCAAVQGARRWQTDCEILTAAGMPEQARECGGLGGLGYALRSITLALGVCRDMRELCPHATLLDVTNPMPRVVTAVRRFGGVACYGFCNAAHGSGDGYANVARMVGRPQAELAVVTAGLNHFSWLVGVRDRRTGENLLPLAVRNVRSGAIEPGPWDGPEYPAVLRHWLERYGAINVVGVDHPAEFLAPDPAVPLRAHSPFHGSGEERRQRAAALQAAAEGRADWRPVVRENPSWEHPVDVAVALHERRGLRVDMINLPNAGFARNGIDGTTEATPHASAYGVATEPGNERPLPQLPAGRIVEVPAEWRGDRMVGLGPLLLPEPAAAICRAVSDVHELVAEGAATGRLELLEQAVETDPAVPDKRAALAVLPRLVAAHADILPQFGHGGSRA